MYTSVPEVKLVAAIGYPLDYSIILQHIIEHDVLEPALLCALIILSFIF